jgi:hypothetical protein
MTAYERMTSKIYKNKYYFVRHMKESVKYFLFLVSKKYTHVKKYTIYPLRVLHLFFS